jgi:hypothetical protein
MLVLLPLLLGCPKQTTEVVDPVAALLRRADEAWTARASVGLEAAEEPLDQAYALAPYDPEVLWRLVRHQVTVGLAEPTPRASLYAFAEGRSLGIACLDTEPLFARQRRDDLPAALGELRPEHDPCVAWTAMAWSRWIVAHGGAAASLDLPRAEALADRAAELGDPGLAALGRWSEGLLLLAAPSWAGGAPEQGLSTLQGLLDDADAVHLHVDRLRYGGDALSTTERRAALQALQSLDTSAPDHRTAYEAVAPSPAPSDQEEPIP